MSEQNEIQIKRGSDLPTMPSFNGATEKIIVFGIRYDTGETVNFPLSEFIRALGAGEIIPKLAESLNIGSDVDVSYEQTRIIETTGGDQDIDSEKKARVVSIRGTLAGVAASGAKIVSVGFNQIPPSGISGQAATFLAVRSAWGAYGKSTENNGYLFTDEDGNIVVPSSVTQNGVAVPTHTENGIVYYLPSEDGEIVVTFASGVDVTGICGHICWSNYRDNEHAEYSVDELSLASVITAMGGYMRRVENSNGYAYDEIVCSDTAAERMWYRRVGSTSAKDLPWSMETIVSGEGESETTTYRFTAAVSGMKSGGPFSVSGGSVTGFYADGANIVVESTTISGVADLKTALDTAELKYALATPVTGTHNLTGLLTVDDFGTIRFEGGATSADFVMKYACRWSDYLKNMPTTIENEGVVTAAALVEIAQRVAGIEKKLSEGLGKLSVEELNVVRTLTCNLMDDGDNENAMILCRTTSPDVAPAFIGQEWIDTTNKVAYKAFGTSAATDWKQISNA